MIPKATYVTCMHATCKNAGTVTSIYMIWDGNWIINMVTY